VKKLLLFVLTLGSVYGSADCNALFGAGGGTAFTASGASVQFSNRSKNCYDWRVSYQSQGFSAVSLIIESAPDVNGVPGTWVTFTVPEVTNPIQGVNPNTNTTQASTQFRGAPAWIRARLASATGTGTVSGTLYGCAEPGCGSGMAASAAAASACPNPCPVTGGPVSVDGVDAAGAAPTVNPVPTAGTDGTLLRAFRTDTSGRQMAVGAAATGAAVTGNPVYVGGNDGTNVQPFKTDTSGRVNMVGAAATGAAVAGNPVYIGGTDGTNVQPFKVTSAANNSSTTQSGIFLHEKGARWSVSSVTGSNTQASASKAAGGAGVRHIVDCVQFSAESTAAITATQDDVILRDGATGAGTVLMQWRNGIVSAAAAQVGLAQSICGLALIGTANTAMTLEFANGITNVLMSVTITGYDVQ